jgi:endonuclease I
MHFPRCFIWLSFPAFAWAAEPPGYYAAAEGTSGSNLRSALHGIIDAHAVQTYTATSTHLRVTDETPGDASRVVLIYSRRNELNTRFINGYTGNEAWNREHLWPNSLGIDDVLPAYSDLHNLRPADVDVNAERGNKLFDETNTAENRVFPGHPEATLTSSDSNSWEPPVEVKGDIARAMFYMDVRYEGDVAGEPNLSLTDALATITSTGANFGRLTTLLLWHYYDPVSAEEIARNDAVYAIQGNRNPFVDRPDWVFKLYGNPLLLTGSLNPAATQVTLTWWDQLTGVTVEASENLTAAPWATLTHTSSLSGNQRTMTFSKTTARRFFRLRYRIPDAP